MSINDESVKEFALDLNENVSLDVSLNKLGKEGAKALAKAISINNSLTSINFSSNQIGDEGTKALCEALNINKSLVSIDLSWNQISDEGAKALAESLYINNYLCSIDLSCNQIGDKGAKLLTEAIRVNKSITSIDLGWNQIREGGAKALAEMLHFNTNLASFHLSNNPIGEGGVKALAEMLRFNNSLTLIFLNYNLLGDQGAKVFAESFGINKSLTCVGLNGNHIGDDGAKAVFESLGINNSITSILLRNNNLDDDAAKVLAKVLRVNKTLKTIDLSMCTIGEKGEKELVEAMRFNYTIISFYGLHDPSELTEFLKRNRLLQWRDQYEVILNMCIAMSTLNLPAYVLLWIYNQYGLGEAAINQFTYRVCYELDSRSHWLKNFFSQKAMTYWLKDIISEINKTDACATEDSYLSFEDATSAEFGIEGSPSCIFKSTENLIDSVGQCPIWCGRAGCAGDDENRVLSRDPPQIPPYLGYVFADKPKTGDLLLFSGHSSTCKTLRQLHWSAFTHVGIVVELDSGIFVMSSTVHPYLYDNESCLKNSDFSSVEISNLAFVVQKFVPLYCKDIYVKVLDNFTLQQKQRLVQIALEMHPQKSNQFFSHSIAVKNDNVNLSAQFVALLLQHCGFIKHPKPHLFVPECFNRLEGTLLKLNI